MGVARTLLRHVGVKTRLGGVQNRPTMAGMPPTRTAGNVARERHAAAGYLRYLGATLEQRYELVSLLGTGGMGAVFLGKHKLIGRPLAVKILDCRRLDEAEGRSRLFREAEAAAAIGHPNIIDVIDVGVSELGDPFLVMEYLEGEDLASFLDANGPLNTSSALPLLEQILLGLQAAHSKGIVHRDLKPGNIFLVRRDGAPPSVKLIDFGIAKILAAGKGLTVDGALMGTPNYMSPEQARGAETVDPRADLFAVGVIFYEMVTGQLPFDGSNYHEILHHIANDELPRQSLREVELSDGAIAFIQRALGKHPEARHQSAAEMLAELGTIPGWSRRGAELARLGTLVRSEPSGIGLETSSTLQSPHAPGPEHASSSAPREVASRGGSFSGTKGSSVGDTLQSLSPPRPTPEEREASSAGAPATLDTTHQTSLLEPLDVPSSQAAGKARAPSGHVSGPSSRGFKVSRARWYGGALVALIGGFLALRLAIPQLDGGRQAAVNPSASAAALARVRIQLVGVPADARVTFDGRRVPESFETEASSALMPLRVEKAGYEPFTATLVPRRDLTVRVRLNRQKSVAPEVVSGVVPTEAPTLPQSLKNNPPRTDGRTASSAASVEGTSTPVPSVAPSETIGKSGRGAMYIETFE